MAGTVLENLSGRKLSVLVAVLLICQVICTMIGALVAPSPADTHAVDATICNDQQPEKKNEPNRWFDMKCPSKINNDGIKAIPKDLNPDNYVFIVQLPLGMPKVDFTRWQQNLVGVLEIDMMHHPPLPLEPIVELTLDVKLAYRNRGNETWEMLAESVEKRIVDCTDGHESGKAMLDGYPYTCSTVPLFELGSLHHDFYLLNIRLPTENRANSFHARIGGLRLRIIYMNGGFTRVWLGMKIFFFPVIASIMVWFWRRVHILSRTPALLEYMLICLGGTLALLDFPLEFLTLYLDMPFMLLVNDIREGIFYAMLLSFWLVFAGEHMLIQDHGERNSIRKYWKHLSAIVIGCASLLFFDFCERGVQLRNPFYTIWMTPLGTNLALSFIILAGISACMYFLFLCYMIWNVFRNISIKRATLPNMSSARRFHYEGIIYRFNFLMVATLVCAAATIILFIFGQVTEGQYNWDDDTDNIEVYAAMFTGVYGMWNVYTCAMLMLYAPSHKQWPAEPICGEHGEEVEFSRLPTDPSPSEISSLTSFASKAMLD